MSVVKVLIVANTTISREYISGLLDGDPEVQTVGFADSADNAKEKISALRPDVVVMRSDSGSNGFLKGVLSQLTLPAVVITDPAVLTLTSVKAESAEFVKMPILKTSSSMAAFTQRLIQQIKASANKKAVSPAAAPVKPIPADPATKAKTEQAPPAQAKKEFAPTKPAAKANETAEPVPKPKATDSEFKAKPSTVADPFQPKKPEPAAAEAAPRPKPVTAASSETVSTSVKASSEAHEAKDPTAKAIAAAAAAKQKLGVSGSPKGRRHVIALGASTGGTDALQTVLQDLPTTTPGIVIVQHMPELFTKMYADRLNRACKMTCVEASDGDRVEVGKIILAAGSYHLRLAKDSKGYYVTSQQGEKVSGHCPSVDVLFESVAKVAGSDAIGAIFTGMGADGAAGLKKMRDAGAFTIGQDEKSCVVYGMPMVAYNMGGVCRQAPLDEIAQIILDNC